MVKRGSGVSIELDGAPLGEHPIYLPGRWRGNVGIVHWKEGEEEARLKGLRFRELPFSFRVLPASLPASDIQSAIAEARSLSALSPRLFEIEASGLSRSPTDPDLLRILAHRFAWEIVPTVRVSAADPEVTAAALEELLASLGDFAGLRVEWNGVSKDLRESVAATLETRAHELSWKAGRLVVSEPKENP
jgi:hypothetical protein